MRVLFNSSIYKLFTVCLSLILCMSSFNSVMAQDQPSDDIQTLMVHFEPKQMIQLISPDTSISKNTKEAAKLRGKYYQEAIPLAQSFGFKNHVQLNVTNTLVGSTKPTALILSSWPSVATFDEFSALPEWPKLKEMRKNAWDELSLYNAEIDHATILTFREDKYYTVLFAWINPEHPSDYLAYLAGIETALNRIGGTFMLKLKEPSIEVHASENNPPFQITFVEWDTKDGFTKLSKQEDYKRYTNLRDSGLRKVEFHQIKPKFPKS
ncbi:hypothetical protein [Alteromonas sp. W364]|uniref:hypothetical protein n=1 Tax=Alteromonas sp. W364 TaxID=3075610 RepID=UPI00288417D6|nr:hypothetical protein [Alteromonas sp. W364]MDT0626719.1 hypothetical protein [Alteromonas sp. W364]